MSKRTVLVVTSAVAAAVALGTSLAWRAAQSAHQPGVHEPLPLAMMCESQVVLDQSCVYDMPKKAGAATTSHCTFTIDCCGAVVQKWKKDFPEPDGRGRFGKFREKLTYSCKVSPNDVDQDGIPNFEDEYPSKPQQTTVAVVAGGPAKPAESPTPTPSPKPTSAPQPETEFELTQIH